MKKTMKAVALALVLGTLGMTGSALAASYRGPQIRRVPHLTRHIGRSYDARKPGRGATLGRYTHQRWGGRQNGQGCVGKVPTTRRAPGRHWQGRSRMR